MELPEEIYREGVRFARHVVESVLLEQRSLDELLAEAKKKFPEKPQGIFTTIKRYPSQELRGCIGIPEPVYPFYKALVYSAYWAAFEDPRFEPLRAKELDNVIFEVSYLTEPRELRVSSPLEYPKKIVVGRHGIIVRKGALSGLLLPQVPVENGWTAEEFLSYGCMKAGLLPDCWLEQDTKIYVFEAIVYAEDKPKGEVKRLRLADHQ
jgi:uncharacterized protein (TIGR00296 family)